MNTNSEPSISEPSLPIVSARTTILIMACLLFVLSGACGLAYEVVWTRFLGRFLGNTVLLHAAVLGTFMGGLALGSLFISRFLPRIKEPLKAYGWLELCVAGYALIFPTLADSAANVIPIAAASFGVGTLSLLLVRIGLGVVLLFPPTLLMGATLPLLTAAVERLTSGTDRREQGENGANWLYFANCAGAVLGTLVTGFFLIPSLGLSATVQGVGILNALVGLGAVVAGVRFLSQAPASSPVESVASSGSLPAERSAAPIYFAICLSGATAFLYELVWTRLFAISLGSSTYSFTLMLAAFISGLCLGGICANLLPTRRMPLLWFAGAEIAIGAVIALSVFYYPRLPLDLLHWRWILRPVLESLNFYRFGVYAILFGIMLLPTFLFGLTFPTAIRSALRLSNTQTPDAVAEQTASVYGWNTLGTLLGVTLTGAVLIPRFGLQHSLQIGALTNVFIGGLVLFLSGRDSDTKTVKPMIGYAVAALAILVTVFLTPRWSLALMNYGTFRYDHPPVTDFAELKRMASSRKIIFSEEDFGTTVVVVRAVSATYNNMPQNTLIVDGKPDATSIGDLPTQMLLGHLPLLLKPDAKDIYVLGLGSGVTVANVLKHPISHMDCLEISPAVINASRYFAETTKGALNDPRLNLVTDDGKAFLASTPHRYDILINEPTNLWISGTGDLFSEEMFRSCAKVLKPGGICVQWFHASGLNDELAATVIRTFHRTFPHVLIFEGNISDYLMIGSMEPLKPDYSALETRMAEPVIKADLESIGITRIAALLTRQTHNEFALPELEKNGGINSDDLPILEYQAPDMLYTGDTAKRLAVTDQRFQRGSGLFIEDYLRSRLNLPVAEQQKDYRSILQTLTENRSGNGMLAHRLVEEYTQIYPHDGEFWRYVADMYVLEKNWGKALEAVERAQKEGGTIDPRLLSLCQSYKKKPIALMPSRQ